MKKILLAFALLLATGQASAQSTEQKTHVSLSAGYSITTMYDGYINKNKECSNFINFGVNLQHFLDQPNKGAYVQTGVHYSPVGYDIIEATFEAYHRANHLVVPVQLGYQFPVDETVVFYTAVGVYGSTELSSKSYYKDERQRKTNIDKITRLDAGLNITVGVNVSSKFSVAVDGKFGLVNMLKSDYRRNAPNTLHNNRVGLLFSYTL